MDYSLLVGVVYTDEAPAKLEGSGSSGGEDLASLAQRLKKKHWTSMMMGHGGGKKWRKVRGARGIRSDCSLWKPSTSHGDCARQVTVSQPVWT